MSISHDYMRRRDQLFSDLGVTESELVYVQRHCKGIGHARRFALLINECLEARTGTDRRSLFLQLWEVVLPDLRKEIQAVELAVPEGYHIVPAKTLEAYRGAIQKALEMSGAIGSRRDHLYLDLLARCRVVENLDPGLFGFGGGSALGGVVNG